MAAAVSNYCHQASPSGLCSNITAAITTTTTNNNNIQRQTKRKEQRMNQSDYSISFDDQQQQQRQQHRSNDDNYQQDLEIVNKTTSTIPSDHRNEALMYSSTRSVPNLSMAPFSTRPPPPPPPPTSSHHHLPPPPPPSFGTNRTINLKTMLDIFQSAISQRQAWALLHQALKSLRCLLPAPSQVSLLRELDSFEQFSLDMQGNVTTSTWLGEVDRLQRRHSLGSSSTSSSQVSLPFADEEADDDGMRARSRISSSTPIHRNSKPPTTISPNIQSIIHIILASLAKIIYSALSQTFADDEEPDLDEDLEDLLGYMIKLDNVAEHVGAALPLKKLNNTYDEGVCEDEEDECLVYAIRLVLEKCEEYFYFQFTKLKNNDAGHKMSDVCPIMEMLVQRQASTGTPIDADLYFQTVCRLMVDEAFKLYKLLDQLYDIHSNNSKSKTGPSTSSCSTGNLLLRQRAAEDSVDTENLKLWAQTWIKVMSELRFGVHLHPVSPDHKRTKLISPAEEFQTRIQSGRDNLRKVDPINLNQTIHLPISPGGDLTDSIGVYRRHLSLPSITEKMIVQKLKSLRPAMERNLSQLPPPKPCLHDSLMTEIRQSNVNLRPTKTVVKCNVTQLYLEERRRRGLISAGRARPQSEIALNSSSPSFSTPKTSFFSPLRKKPKVSTDAYSTMEKSNSNNNHSHNFLRRFRSSMSMGKASSKKRFSVVENGDSSSGGEKSPSGSTEFLRSKSHGQRRSNLAGTTTGPLLPTELYRPLVYLDRYSSMSSHHLWNEHANGNAGGGTNSSQSTRLHNRSPRVYVSPPPLMATQSTLNIVRPMSTMSPTTTVLSKRVNLPPVQSCSCLNSPSSTAKNAPPSGSLFSSPKTPATSTPTSTSNSFGFFRRSFITRKQSSSSQNQPSAYLDLRSSTSLPPTSSSTRPTKSFLGSIFNKFFSSSSSSSSSNHNRSPAWKIKEE